MSVCVNLITQDCSFWSWISNWQTLLAGSLALGGAYWTVRQIRTQINQSEVHRQDEIARRHAAARVVLPLALSSISELTQTIVDNVADLIEIYGGENWLMKLGKDAVSPFADLQLDKIISPSEALSSLQDFVETLTEDDEVRHVAEFVSSLQIAIARNNSFKLGRTLNWGSAYTVFISAAKVRLLTDTMYNYARFVDSSSFCMVGQKSNEDVWKELKGKAQGLVFMREEPDLFFQGINEIIDPLIANGSSPWNEKFE